jgi:hypothetical protein
MRNQTATTLALLVLTGAVTGGAARAQDAAAPGAAVAVPDAGVAPAGAIQIALPFNKAVVRESVPVRLRDFPDGGYVSVAIDDRFITAQALPKRRTEPVYVWDTKAGYVSADDPNTTKFYADGTHALTLTVYDAQSKLVGKDSVSVQLANKIGLPAGQGITLAYPWKTNTVLRYQRRTTLTASDASATSSTPPQVLQESLLRYRRTVENATGGSYLIRDEVLPVDKSVRPKPFVSYVSSHSQVSTLGEFHAKYREVDARGHVSSELESQNGANSLGFSIPVLPPRRVSVGAHWESPVKISLDWTSPAPETVLATSTLEDFEWQDRYPTAKIRETYTGPATFRPGPGSVLPPIASQDIHFERIIYFAYNAGRIVRMQTTLTLTTATPGLLSAPSGAGGYPGSPSPYGGASGGPGRRGGGSFPGESSGGFPGQSSSGGPGFPGQSSSSPSQYPGGYPGQYPGSSSYGQAAAPVDVKLHYDETSVIIL